MTTRPIVILKILSSYIMIALAFFYFSLNIMILAKGNDPGWFLIGSAMWFLWMGIKDWRIFKKDTESPW